MKDHAHSNDQKSVTLDDLAIMVKNGFDEIEQKMFTKDEAKEMEGRISQKVMKESHDTRDYAAKKMTELDGTSVRRDAALNTKMDSVAHKLQDKSVFTAEEVREISRIAPVAVSPMP